VSEPGSTSKRARSRRTVVLISAVAEWRAVRALFLGQGCEITPFGEFFQSNLEGEPAERQVLFFHGGWGKIAAAASTQYVIDRWAPGLLVNLGTCGGFEGEIKRGAVVLAERTLVYDIIEQMGDQSAHIAHYTTEIDLSWLREPFPHPVVRGMLVSADRDLLPTEVGELKERYGAVAGDWESGAIAWVAARNQAPCLILRGVTDLVGEQGGEAYGDPEFFAEAAERVMGRLVEALPGWLESWREASAAVGR
jgi:adenosylhomocysteine nucleosidase